jgi:hypothetical protein
MHWSPAVSWNCVIWIHPGARIWLLSLCLWKDPIQTWSPSI